MSKDNGLYRCYVPKNFGEKALAMIGQANAIIGEYEQKGFALTLRQLYYQFVARGLLENSGRNYDRLGSVINDGRLAGLVSWTAIEDRGRNLRGLNHYLTPADAIKAARDDFRLDLWHDQPFRPEVWIEKEALAGVIGEICNHLRVDFFACKGYNSQSEQWRAGRRFAGYIQKGQRPIVFHLGDHDPSGIDMTRDNRERLSLFAGMQIQVTRLALNMPQIERFNPPPNPAKLSDSRAADYIRTFGDESWELDALDPEYIRQIISTAVVNIRDEGKWLKALQEEDEERQYLDHIIEMAEGKDADPD